MDDKYIDKNAHPHIRDNEFSALKNKDYIIKKKFLDYIRKFIAAEESDDINKKKDFKFSTLHYFKSQIDYNDLVNERGKELALIVQ